MIELCLDELSFEIGEEGKSRRKVGEEGEGRERGAPPKSGRSEGRGNKRRKAVFGERRCCLCRLNNSKSDSDCCIWLYVRQSSQFHLLLCTLLCKSISSKSTPESLISLLHSLRPFISCIGQRSSGFIWEEGERSKGRSD